MSGMPRELLTLMQRFNQLGRLLPQGDEIERTIVLEDVATRAEVRLILDEMDAVKAEIDAFIAAAARTRNEEV